MTITMWPFNAKEEVRPEPEVSDETCELVRRTERLAAQIDQQGRETRAVREEAARIVETNHFAVALISAMSKLPKEKQP